MSNENKEDAVSAFEACLNKCKELNEPRMSLDEFLKSQPNDCWCWIHTSRYVDMAYFSDGVFYWSDQVGCNAYTLNEITHVTPLYKPELPK